jgi:hypothetical protein
LNLKRAFQYPFSLRWVLLSFILVCASVILAIMVLGVDIHIFIITSMPQIFLFLVIKYRLYKSLDVVDGNPLLFFGESEGVEKSSSLYTLLLVLLAFFGFALPFILLLIMAPLMWFVSLLSFIVGINAPELILYLISRSCSQRI